MPSRPAPTGVDAWRRRLQVYYRFAASENAPDAVWLQAFAAKAYNFTCASPIAQVPPRQVGRKPTQTPTGDRVQSARCSGGGART